MKQPKRWLLRIGLVGLAIIILTIIAAALVPYEAQACVTAQCHIKKLAPQYGVSTETALRIGKCESRLDPFARNPRSSAKGTFQFIDKTWKHYCKGNVFNTEDNVRCFLQLYPKHPNWWQCR